MSKFIVITSGKGGVGKTTTAVNLAAAMSSLDEDVALVDINLSTPNVGLHLGAPVVPVTLNHVLARKADLVDAIYEHESGAKVIPSSLSIKDLSALDEVNLTPVMKELRHVADYVIFDSAAGLGSEATSAMAIADEIIIVTNPEMPAVTDALKTSKLAESMGIPVRGVIITRHKGSRNEMPIPNMKEMLELPILGIVPEDESVQESLAMRNAVFSTHPRSRAARSYLAIAGKIVGKEVNNDLGFFDRLLVGLKLRK